MIMENVDLSSVLDPKLTGQLQEAWCVRQAHHPDEILCIVPTGTLPVSVTGTHCALNCAHCGGHYLAHMATIAQAKNCAHKSLLISGGCDASGRVPVLPFLEQIRDLRQGRRLNWHLGLVQEDEIAAIAPYADVVSFDVVGGESTARQVYHLSVTLNEYLQTLKRLQRYVRVVPHITIGLRGGEIVEEYRALDALQSFGLETLVLIVFIPTPGTAYADRMPPALGQVAQFFARARCLLPETRLYLGCMRPGGDYRRTLDVLAVRAGLNGIVNPTSPARRLAKEMGLVVRWEEECCAFY